MEPCKCIAIRECARNKLVSPPLLTKHTVAITRGILVTWYELIWQETIIALLGNDIECWSVVRGIAIDLKAHHIQASWIVRGMFKDTHCSIAKVKRVVANSKDASLWKVKQMYIQGKECKFHTKANQHSSEQQEKH